jgi:hypothetical protein
MENVMVLGKKVFYIPAVNSSSLLKKSDKREVASNENRKFELQRHWSQSEEELEREREIFNDILDIELKRGA